MSTTTEGITKTKSKKVAKISGSKRANLVFPVGRLARHLKDGRYSERVSKSAAVYMAAVLEYLSAELLEVAGNVAKDSKKKRIVPRHIMLAVRGDTDLDKLLQDVTFPYSSVVPKIHESLFANKGKAPEPVEEGPKNSEGPSMF